VSNAVIANLKRQILELETKVQSYERKETDASQGETRSDNINVMVSKFCTRVTAMCTTMRATKKAPIDTVVNAMSREGGLDRKLQPC
jgi:hypothetical protein